jgi:4-diphosphocytidyl-2-C-methyl-D-erythritol kinase
MANNDVRISVDAPAKINLFLHVVGRRPDGYHLLESLFVFTETGDRLHLNPSDVFSFAASGPFADQLSVSTHDDNLVVRAANLIASTAGQALDVSIELEKNLPIASGIGGGSADAAATLKLLNSYWNLNWPTERLEALALELGADVPACLHETPIMVRGIGEDISHDIAYDGPRHILLVNPLVSVSTPAVFKAFTASSAFDLSLDHGYMSKPSEELLLTTSNSLQKSASGLCPEINEVLKALQACKHTNIVRMAGSGATCFALFDDSKACAQACAIIKANHPNWWCYRDMIKV